MANTISQTTMGTAAPSISQLEQREVGDQIRYLGFGSAVMTSLIENTIIDGLTGSKKSKKGLITKRGVKNLRYEMFTRSARPYKVTVASGTAITGGGVVLDDANGVVAGMTLINARNKTQCRVELVSTNTVTGSSCGGTTFSCAAGDTLMVGAVAVPEGSTTAVIANGTDDQNFNILQYSRLGVSISWVLEATAMLAGGKRFSREKMYLAMEFLADLERTWLFGDYSASYASKNTQTGALTGFTGEYPTTRGLYNLAANSYNMEGQMTYEKLRKNLPLAMGDTINDNQDLVALCGNDTYARMQEIIDAKHVSNASEGELKEFGIKSGKLITSGPNINFVKHSAFNIAGIDNTMLIFCPENVGYVHLEGHDVSPNNKIGGNADHGQTDELYAYHGIETLDAGKSITVVTNLF